MVIITSVVALVGVLFIIGRIFFAARFRQEVEELFDGSVRVPLRVFEMGQLEGLPEPVQRYFKLTLPEGQPYISYLRATHDGQFKTGKGKGWVPITGQQYATTATPGFIWKGVTSMFTARDMYIGGKGRLVVTLFSLFDVVNGRGAHYDQGELLRWLGESVLYPTNLLPSERLQWQSIDAQSARIQFQYNGLDLYFVVVFNAIGEITQLETERYMDEGHIEKWVIKIADYRSISNMQIPTSFEVLWRLKEGDFSYAKFNMKQVEYGVAEGF